jgi:hypothetical protein
MNSSSYKISSGIKPLAGFEIALKRFNDYIETLPLDARNKARLNDSVFIEKNFSFYLCYPYLFSTAFDIDESKVSDLAIAGYLYYKSIIYWDEILDEEKISIEAISMVSICQEESIKLLSSIFSLESPFWNYWNQRRNEYAEAQYVDKVTHKINSFNEFEVHAGKKSAFGKVAIDALYLMSGCKNPKLYKDLIKSHDLFYSAFQIIDDIRDLRKDLDCNQFNVASYFFLKKFDSTNKDSPEEISKKIYLSGIAVDLLKRGLKSLADAEMAIQSYPLTGWLSEIRRLHNIIITHILNINGYIQSIEVKARLSHQISRTSDSPQTSILEGIEFLKRFQKKDGSWQDFFNDAGVSDSWSTSFVLNFLPVKYQNAKFADRAYQFLHYSQGGLWGYNKQWLADADSSTFALLTILSREGTIDQELLSQWVTFQAINGGFSTYNDKEALLSSLSTNRKINNVEGWTQSHPCVSSVAFYLLSMMGDQSLSFYRLKDYIIGQQKKNGLWDSYWWTSPIYTTAFIIKSSLCEVNADMSKRIELAIEGLMRMQNKNGSFGDLFEAQSPFYTGLVVGAICQQRAMLPSFIREVAKSVQWLKSVQFDDGSWKETPSMRMPNPDIITFSEGSTWPEGTRGLNIRVSDFSRLFSTVTVISALSYYEETA